MKSRHRPPNIINVKRFVQTKKRKARLLKIGIDDLKREKTLILEIIQELSPKLTELHGKTDLTSDDESLVRKLNQKLVSLKSILVNEEKKVKTQILELEAMKSKINDFVYATIDEVNEITKESRSLVQELQIKNNT